MPSEHSQPDLGACIELAITNAFVSDAVDREVVRRGLSVTQAGLLRIIDAYGPVTPSELERRTALPPSTLRDRVRVLVRGRYVARSRSSTDGRSFVLEVTETGRAYLAQVMPLVAQLETRIDEELDGRLDEFRGMLTRIRVVVAASGSDELER
ncbi:MAG: MarR family winged helix-turn-helix transcriptional regulator [Actinomycetes bacterium]|jgi:DNA-binding MarR family transcriptional regulator|nr:MarR family transcriptional regulator [Actinomycetes bacterium]